MRRSLSNCIYVWIIGCCLLSHGSGLLGAEFDFNTGWIFQKGEVSDAEKVSFDSSNWELEDHPLTPLRISFNWHNFLSSCSTWDLTDWKHWISQSQKVGFDTVMVHAYGSNPMFSYMFNG